jgi:hypothetical protein
MKEKINIEGDRHASIISQERDATNVCNFFIFSHALIMFSCQTSSAIIEILSKNVQVVEMLHHIFFLIKILITCFLFITHFSISEQTKTKQAKFQIYFSSENHNFDKIMKEKPTKI